MEFQPWAVSLIVPTILFAVAWGRMEANNKHNRERHDERHAENKEEFKELKADMKDARDQMRQINGKVQRHEDAIRRWTGNH